MLLHISDLTVNIFVCHNFTEYRPLLRIFSEKYFERKFCFASFSSCFAKFNFALELPSPSPRVGMDGRVYADVRANFFPVRWVYQS